MNRLDLVTCITKQNSLVLFPEEMLFLSVSALRSFRALGSLAPEYTPSYCLNSEHQTMYQSVPFLAMASLNIEYLDPSGLLIQI